MEQGPQKRTRVEEADSNDGEDPAVQSMQNLTMWAAIRNLPKKGSKTPDTSAFRVPTPSVQQVMMKDDADRLTLAGFALTYDDQMFLLPIDHLQTWNCYDLSDKYPEVYAPFPLVKQAREISNAWDKASVGVGREEDVDFEFSAPEMKALRSVILPDGRDVTSTPEGEGFVFFNKDVSETNK
jgi:hypothetical protein